MKKERKKGRKNRGRREREREGRERVRGKKKRGRGNRQKKERGERIRAKGGWNNSGKEGNVKVRIKVPPELTKVFLRSSPVEVYPDLPGIVIAHTRVLLIVQPV